MYFVPGRAGVRGKEIADKVARDCSVPKFVGPELSLGVSTQNIKRKIQPWVDYQHLAMRRGPRGTHRKARKLFSGPSPTTKTRLLSFNKTKSKVAIGLLTGHNILRRYLHSKGWPVAPYVVDVVLRKIHQSTDMHIRVPFFLDLEDIRSLLLRDNWKFNKGRGLPWPSIRLRGKKGLF